MIGVSEGLHARVKTQRECIEKLGGEFVDGRNGRGKSRPENSTVVWNTEWRAQRMTPLLGVSKERYLNRESAGEEPETKKGFATQRRL